MTPLMAAVRFDDYEKAQLLIKNGADLNTKTPDGFNVWDFIGKDESKKISKLLKKSGAKEVLESSEISTPSLDKSP